MKIKNPKKLLTLCMVSIFTLAPCQAAYAYSDIEGLWAESAILTLSSQFMIYNDNTDLYRPNDPQTRGETAYFIDALGITADTDSEQMFTDVTRSTPLYRQIRYAVATGLLRAYPDGTFRPDLPLTRNEAFVIASYLLPVRYETNVSISFDDSDTIAAYALPAVDMLVGYNILGGYPDNTIRADSPITRAEFAHLFASVFTRRASLRDADSFSAHVTDWQAYPSLHRPYLTADDLATYGVGSASGYVRAGSTRMAGASVTFEKDGSSFRLTTDSSGYYTVSDLPLGTYTVTASLFGYPTVSDTLTVSEGSGESLTINLLRANQPKTYMYGYVSDKLTTESIEGALVRITINETEYSTYTSASGFYQLYLPAGHYTLNVSCQGYLSQALVTLVEAVKTNSNNISLQPES